MRLLDKIRDFFRKLNKNPNKLLLEEKTVTNRDNTFRDNIRYENVKPQGIDFAIEQYIYALLYQYQNNKPFNSYNALVSRGGMQVEFDEVANLKEERLISEIKSREDIQLEETFSSDGNLAFYHVHKNRSTPINYRVYLNCKNKNLPDLVKSLINEIKDMNSYYFKFNPQCANTVGSRSEQIVFYSSDEDNLNKIVDSIRRIRIKEPELFDGSENVNPFLKKIDGYICYAPQPKVSSYKTIDGSEKEIQKSYNFILSTALEDCFIHSISDLVSRDVELSQKMNFEYFSSASPYIQNVLETVCSKDNLKIKLINNMKSNLQLATRNNSVLEIPGIERSDNLDSYQIRG